MDEDLVHRLTNNAKYQELIEIRTRFGLWLTAIVMLVYYGYILLIAFNKDLLAKKLGDGVTTWGIPIGLFVIVFTILITGYYVRRANHEFDDMTQTIRREVGA